MKVNHSGVPPVSGAGRNPVAPLLSARVARIVGSRIVKGRWPAGTILPNEAALSLEFGVSRTALREAIKMLVASGLVDVRRKTGTRVLPRSRWNILDPNVLEWHFSGSGIPAGIEDLLELRRIVEPAAARLAATRHSEDDLHRIQSAYDGMRGATGRAEDSIVPDLEFHLSILEASHNLFLRPFGALIRAALTASFRLTNADLAAFRRSLLHHQAVLVAIRSRRPDAAERAMRTLLAATSRDVRSVIHVPASRTSSARGKARRKERSSHD